MQPERIGRYEILELLGRGGQAAVYRAYDPTMQREVAIKVLTTTAAVDEKARQRFEREAHTIAALEHPNIVPVYDFGAYDDGLYIVMRLMKGGTLADRLAHGPLNPAEALEVVRPIAAALDAAHKRGIVHRDIKPGNILFDEYGAAYLSDFGIARLGDATASLTGSLILGTPHYMSPEQIQGNVPLDGRSDVYALGALLFQMLTGHVPYEGDTPAQALVKHLQEPIPRLADYRPALPEAYQAIIDRAMAKDREARYPTAGALAADLEAAVTDRPLASAPTLAMAPPAAGRRAGKRLPWWAWAAAGLAVLALVGAGWALWGRRTSPPPTPTLAASPTALVKTSLPVAAATTAVPTPSPPPTPTPTVATSPTSPPTPTFTPAASPTPALGGKVLGGTDLLAVLSGGDLWFVSLDGHAQRITTDGGDKHGLEWLSPDRLLYLNGKCVFTLTTADPTPQPLVCFRNTDSLDAFRISPDGKRVAIVLDNKLYIADYDLKALSNYRDPDLLPQMPGFCARFVADTIHEVRWSADGSRLAARVTVPIGGGRAGDQIEILNPVCGQGIYRQHTFPGNRFPMRTYNQVPRITAFDWDGDKQFVFTLYWRNLSFGDMYLYSRGTYTGERIQPIQTSDCCYAAPAWSPDGTYLSFFFQDINDPKGKIFLYHIPAGTIGAGVNYKPLPLDAPIFPSPRTYLEIAPRPAP
ncbi:MAG TPA: serine/threonine protein kinase [Chloroflexi bacterium]|nr:serine/threonine protein kinase [Chloroflexota bacterium]